MKNANSTCAMPKVPFWIFLIAAFVYFSAVRVDTMDVDASQYAEMSLSMSKSHTPLQLYDRGADYLDKPPFLFWVNAASMRAFGANNFAYKLPSILFAVWAVFATYRVAKLLYDEDTGRISALLLATCQGMFLMTNDVRCDTILMAWVVTAIWQLAEWSRNQKPGHLLGGCVAIGFGMMTKGPIALMVPVFCFISDWSLKRRWDLFFKPQYLLGIAVIAILLIPMCIGLYTQYDTHPEKKISGLRFFFWSQSFGRITGESPWKNGADMSFLLLNMLWSFLPWIFLFVAAMVVNAIALVKNRFRLPANGEGVATGGFLLSYLSLGSSAYQLPHYIFVAFPLAAIVTGAFLVRMLRDGAYPKLLKFFKPFQSAILMLLFFALCMLTGYCFPAGPVVWAALAICLGFWFWLFFRKHQEKLVTLGVVGSIIVNLFITNALYPTLLTYQAGNTVGRFIKKTGIPTQSVISYKMHDAVVALHFYAQDLIPGTDSIQEIGARTYVLTMDEGLHDLQQRYLLKPVFIGKLFKVSELTPEFLNPATRDKELKNYYLMHIEGKAGGNP